MNMKSRLVIPETMRPYIGCAGWSIPKEFSVNFPGEGSHLERYASVFDATEINSSFYRPHKPATYERWREMVPDSFRFAVKMPKTITHSLKLKNAEDELTAFLNECSNLGEKLGVLLVQLPPSLAYEKETVDAFFTLLRTHFEGDVALEPRHVTWFAPAVDRFLSGCRIARVAADPGLMAEASIPGGWNDLVYYRLHGSPRIYYSGYSPDYLGKLAHQIREAVARGSRVWCIFDNTAEGAATGDALAVTEMLNNENDRNNVDR